MKQKELILVAVRCTVYNHEPYLRDCLEGFVMQKTNFRFVAVVHDDCSTDNSVAIIREYAEKYPDIIKPIYETENQYSKHDGSLGCIMNAAIDATGAKYIAMCEGDDYWTDPYKLQKQVDFMEEHSDYSLCCHGYRILNVDSGEQTEVLHNEKGGEGFEFSNAENHYNWYTKTLTLLIRKTSWDQLPDTTPYKYWRDTHMNYFLLKHSKGYYLNFIGGTYHAHNKGIHSSLSEVEKHIVNLNVDGEIYLHNKDDEDLTTYFLGEISDAKMYVERHIKCQDNSTKLKECYKKICYLMWVEQQYRPLLAWHVELAKKVIKGSNWYQKTRTILRDYLVKSWCK